MVALRHPVEICRTVDDETRADIEQASIELRVGESVDVGRETERPLNLGQVGHVGHQVPGGGGGVEHVAQLPHLRLALEQHNTVDALYFTGEF